MERQWKPAGKRLPKDTLKPVVTFDTAAFKQKHGYVPASEDGGTWMWVIRIREHGREIESLRQTYSREGSYGEVKKAARRFATFTKWLRGDTVIELAP